MVGQAPPSFPPTRGDDKGLNSSSSSTQEIFTLPEAAQQFSFERVNRAGAKFDWAKLDWINSQYLHKMPASELVDLLIPYWQAAGLQFDPVGDRSWLEQMATVIGPSLTSLTGSGGHDTDVLY